MAVFSKVDQLANKVVQKLVEEGFTSSRTPTVEDIQDIVESTLIDCGNSDIAKAYIVYRYDMKEIMKATSDVTLFFKSGGSLLVRLDIDQNATQIDIKKSIEKVAELTSSFKPVKKVALCGECGFKDEHFVDKCPKCKSSYVI